MIPCPNGSKSPPRATRHLLVPHLLHERLRAAARDSSEVRDQLRPRHADAGVGYRERVGSLVGLDPDLEWYASAAAAVAVVAASAVAAPDAAGGTEVTQLLERVARVRHELAQEHLPVCVEGVSHDVEELSRLCLEFHLVLLDGGGGPGRVVIVVAVGGRVGGRASCDRGTGRATTPRRVERRGSSGMTDDACQR